MKEKWKMLAIIETVVIIAVVVFALGFFIGRGNNNSNTTPSQEEVAVEVTTAPTQVANNEQTTKVTNQTKDSNAANDSNETATEQAGETFEVEEVKGVSVEFAIDTSWGSDSEKFYSYKVIISNNSEDEFKDWGIKIPVDENVKISSSWNTNACIVDSVLYIKPVEFNNAIANGDKNESIGIILSAAGEIEIKNEEIGTIKGTSDKNDESKNAAESTTGADATKTAEQNSADETKKITSSESGALKVSGTKIVDAKGNEVVLKGVSTHGIAWFPEYVNEDALKSLKDMGANAFRIAMYTGEYGGYCVGGDKNKLKELVNKGVDIATNLSMYVIIDWHILSDNNPNTNKAESISFFDEMSKKYSGYDNVLYEICNEPNGGTSWSDVKSYAEEVIKTIRNNDKDAIIIVGTPTWCQDVDVAAKDPIKGYDNIMYALHFYAATHKENIQNKMKQALDSGLPIIVSEFSICDASGNGGIDYDSAKKWIDLLNDNKISYVCWNLSNKAETSSIIKSSCSKTGNFTKDDLSEAGKWILEQYAK